MGVASSFEVRQITGYLTLLEAWIYEHFPVERPAPDLKYNPAYPRAMRWRSTASSISAAQAPNRLKHIRHLLDTLIKENTSYAIASTLNIVQTSHSYGDLLLISRAAQLGKDMPSAYMVEMARVEKSFNLRTSEAVEFLDRYFAMNPDTSGRVKIHDFLRVLRLGFSSLSEKIFSFIDVEKRGSITFRQFLYGSALIRKQPSFERACLITFEECDEGKGYITKQQFADAVRAAVIDITNENVSELFKLFDIDNDENISWDDFLSCLTKYPLLIALFAPCTMHHNLL